MIFNLNDIWVLGQKKGKAKLSLIGSRLCHLLMSKVEAWKVFRHAPIRSMPFQQRDGVDAALP
jgi:hypothetical protein